MKLERQLEPKWISFPHSQEFAHVVMSIPFRYLGEC